MTSATAAPAFSMSTAPGRPMDSIVLRSASRICAAVSTGLMPATVAQLPPEEVDGQDHGGEDPAVVDEGAVGPRLHVGEEHADAQQPDDGGGDHPDPHVAVHPAPEEVR